MASERHFSTYRTYKAGTGIFTKWLVDNAKRVGRDVAFLKKSPPIQGATLGVDYVESSTVKSSAASRIIPVKEFPLLARAIVDSHEPTIRVPNHIVNILRNVISLRRCASTFFAKHSVEKTPAMKAADNGHRHFVSVLEEVLNILRPSEARIKDVERPVSDHLNNLFDALTVEEPTLSSTATPTASRKSRETQQHYEPGMSKPDTLFMAFTILHDVTEIRKYLKSVWRDYRSGQLNLTAAAVTTDTAFHIIKRTTTELADPSLGGGEWAAMMEPLIRHIGGRDHVGEDFVDCAALHTAGLLEVYCRVVGFENIPSVESGQFGVYEPKLDRNRMSPEQKFLEDKAVVMELLPEFAKIARICNVKGGKLNAVAASYPTQDELTTSLAELMSSAAPSPSLSAHLIFNMQILLDIHHILREEVTRPFDQLQAFAHQTIATLDGHVQFMRNAPSSPRNSCQDKAIFSLRQEVEAWALTDQLEKAFKSNRPTSRPAFHLFRNHPVLSGLLIFRWSLLLQELGIKVCNSRGAVISLGHLYNACQQSADLEPSWDDMEYVINTHSASRLFVGALPTELNEYLRRFSLALGGSATNFARNRRAGGLEIFVGSKKGPRGLKTTSPVRDIFHPRYVEKSCAVLCRPNILALLAVSSKRVQRTSPASVNLVDLSKKMAAQHQYTNLEVLQAVREGVAAEELHHLFDYLGLQQRGHQLLCQLRSRLHDTFVDCFGPNYIEDEDELPSIVGYIFEMIRASCRAAEQLRVEESVSAVLCTAVEVIGEFLRQDTNAHNSIANAKARSHAVVYG